jgi:hypothetical protein
LLPADTPDSTTPVLLSAVTFGEPTGASGARPYRG